MGLIDFVKDAGAKLFGGKKSPEEMATVLTKAVADTGLEVKNLKVSVQDGTAIVEGSTATQAAAEKVVLAIGNTEGVARVDNRLTVEKPEPVATMYTVKKGDTLSAIAKAHYGEAREYPAIFEANKPMLKDPDKIYPGQVLRIPSRQAKAGV